jgi:hypothetical protein
MAVPPRVAVAFPVTDTRTTEPGFEAGSAAHTAIPTAATAASTDTTVAIRLARSHCVAENTPPRPATTNPVISSTNRRPLIPQSWTTRGIFDTTARRVRSCGHRKVDILCGLRILDEQAAETIASRYPPADHAIGGPR